VGEGSEECGPALRQVGGMGGGATVDGGTG
jgi:hypothetical protein